MKYHSVVFAFIENLAFWLGPRSVHLSLLDVKVLESGSGCTGFANITKLDKTAKSKPHHQPAAAVLTRNLFPAPVEERHKKLTRRKVRRQKFVFPCICGSAVFSLKKVRGGSVVARRLRPWCQLCFSSLLAALEGGKE